MHDGRLIAGTDCDETGSYDSARGKEGARATASDLGHEGEQEKLLSDLDREIEELETSFNIIGNIMTTPAHSRTVRFNTPMRLR